MHRRNILQTAGAALATALLSQAQQQSPASAVVFEHDLPEVNLHNWAVTVRELTYAPGGTSSAHRHPGITLVYVLEGEIVSKVGDGPEKTYGRGQMFMESPNDLHAVSRNASATKPARFIALLLAEKGKALTSPA
jgi:quercetin dioxygenase-like cupin family protein